MPAPPRSFLTVTDTAIRWQVPALDIAGWAIDGEIALSAVLPAVETADKQIASGIVEIDGADVVALFRRVAQASAGPTLPSFEEIRMGMDRSSDRWRRRHRGGRDHPAQGV